MPLHRIAAAVEVLTGIALLVAPRFVVWVILGHDLAGGGALAGRGIGVALIAFAASCWRWPTAAARRAILVFQPLVALPLLAVALFTSLGGPLLWPAILYHTAAWIVLARRG